MTRGCSFRQLCHTEMKKYGIINIEEQKPSAVLVSLPPTGEYYYNTAVNHSDGEKNISIGVRSMD